MLLAPLQIMKLMLLLYWSIKSLQQTAEPRGFSHRGSHMGVFNGWLLPTSRMFKFQLSTEECSKFENFQCYRQEFACNKTTEKLAFVWSFHWSSFGASSLVFHWLLNWFSQKKGTQLQHAYVPGVTQVCAKNSVVFGARRAAQSIYSQTQNQWNESTLCMLRNSGNNNFGLFWFNSAKIYVHSFF